MAGLVDTLNPDIISGQSGMDNIIEKFMIGDMTPHNALDKMAHNTLMIVPGNREGLILTALCENMLRKGNDHQISGIVFTDNIKPHDKIIELLKTTGIPLLLMKEDAFHVATQITSRVFKIRSGDSGKIKIAENLIERYVDVDGIISQL